MVLGLKVRFGLEWQIQPWGEIKEEHRRSTAVGEAWVADQGPVRTCSSIRNPGASGAVKGNSAASRVQASGKGY